MFNSGNSFADRLFIAVTFLPLLPAMFIFFQKTYGREPLNLLLIICLANFIRDLPVHLYMLDTGNQRIIDNVFYAIELVLFARLFRTILPKHIRDIQTISLVAYLSSLVTWLTTQGWATENAGLEIIQSGVLIGMLLIDLPFLVQDRGLYILRSPLFWIAGGTLFYFLILFLLQCVTSCRPLLAEDKIFMSITTLVRYALYMPAALYGREAMPAEEKRL
jgi:hypothetical protein